MSVEERILTCRLLEKMKILEVYGKKLGLEDASRVRGMRIKESADNWQRKDRD